MLVFCSRQLSVLVFYKFLKLLLYGKKKQLTGGNNDILKQYIKRFSSVFGNEAPSVTVNDEF
jgi:hypothetical protein